jgi:hypothetical protein
VGPPGTILLSVDGGWLDRAEEFARRAQILLAVDDATSIHVIPPAALRESPVSGSGGR